MEENKENKLAKEALVTILGLSAMFGDNHTPESNQEEYRQFVKEKDLASEDLQEAPGTMHDQSGYGEETLKEKISDLVHDTLDQIALGEIALENAQELRALIDCVDAVGNLRD